QCFTGKARAHEPANFGVVRFAVSDGVIEDRRIRGQSRDRQLIDVAFERAAVEQLARYVIEPDALTQVVERLSSLHDLTSKAWFATIVGFTKYSVQCARSSKLSAQILWRRRVARPLAASARTFSEIRTFHLTTAITR